MAHIKFLHISDTHYRDEYDGDLDKWGVTYDPVEIFRNFLSTYNFKGIDFVVHTGDLVHDGYQGDYESLKLLIDKYVPSDIPVYYCLGNHDKKNEFYKGFYQEDKSEHYTHIEYCNGYRLIFLDTSSEEIHDGEISKEQADWLFRELSEPYGEGSLIFQHHPLEISWVRGLERTIVPDGYIEKLNQTDVLGIFTGHLHQNRHVILGSIPQHTAGSFVFGMNRIDNTIWNTDRLGYSEVELHGKEVDVYTEIVNPRITKTNTEIL